MGKALLVGLGGCIGSVMRYGLAIWVTRMKGAALMPLETLAVNGLGCLAAGVVIGVAAGRGLSDGARLFWLVGVLGGFTTFSAFGLETFQLLRAGHGGTAALNAVLQVGVGLAAVALGYALARAAAPA